MPSSVLIEPPSLPGLCPLTEAVAALARAEGSEARGAVYTRREVADFILDLVGYTETRPLHALTLLEPSFGGGDFLLPAIKRLLKSRRLALECGSAVRSLEPCIRAVELHGATFSQTRQKILDLLAQEGFSTAEAGQLAAAWLIEGDFLLASLPAHFDFVVGNPPYVRQELIPGVLLSEYRRRFATLYDRADLYVPFIERSLSLLAPGGQLGFICSDRWMKNRYGGPLRALVARQFHLRVHVDMVDTPAFMSDVIAYPAITVIGRELPGPTRVAERPPIEPHALRALAQCLRGTADLAASPSVRELHDVAQGTRPWVLHAADQLDLVRRIEAAFPALEEAGCKVGIGVATGADKVFIGRFGELDVEPDRKLPLVMTRDIVTGRVQWRGDGVINPFRDDGRLVDLERYPRLRRYLETHRDVIAARHVARKSPANWYRTIDRITPELAGRPKLLIPDIKGEAQVVFEEGMLYPHHNLYFVVSDTWDLKALQAVLLSRLARFFVATYSTRMRGGYLRFQAQYLRRIRLPRWDTVADDLRQRLADAAERLDLDACDEAVAVLYQLTPGETEVLAAT